MFKGLILKVRFARHLAFFHTQNIQLSVAPRVSLYDSVVNISLTGLTPCQPVTLTANVEYEKAKFESRAMFTATEDGEVNCHRQASVGGTYKGTHAMGLLWSLRPLLYGQRRQRLLPRDVYEPIRYRLRAWAGHVTHNDGRLLAETEIERHLLHWHVSRTTINEGRLRGVFFAPKEPKHALPAIVDLFGTAGGLVQHRGALLAAHGFAVLSLAYFAYEDLAPKPHTPIDLSYFEEASEWLSQQPHVISDKIGMIGLSLGADIALLSGIHVPKYTAIVSINGFHVIDPAFPIAYRGQRFRAAAASNLLVPTDEDGLSSWVDYREQIYNGEHLVYPMEQSSQNTKFLLIACSDDQITPTVRSANKLRERLVKFGRGDQCRVVELEAAGHLLEPPYTPHCYYSFHKTVGLTLKWGGEMQAHARAQENAWSLIKDFFSENIGNPAQMPPFQKFTKQQDSLSQI